jgi:hypothetical protein
MNRLLAFTRASLLLALGLPALAVGVALFAYAELKPAPDRAGFTHVEGMLSSAKKITRTSRKTGSKTVVFELGITKADSGSVTLTIPERVLSEYKLRPLINRPVQAEYNDTDEVYSLASGGNIALTYEVVAEDLRRQLRDKSELGQIVMILGGVLIAIGIPLAARNRRRSALTAATATSEGG